MLVLKTDMRTDLTIYFDSEYMWYARITVYLSVYEHVHTYMPTNINVSNEKIFLWETDSIYMG